MNTIRLRIAVADDEPDMRDFFVKVLRHLGHEVVAVAANGAELVRMSRETKPDLIITDIAMPELDGLEAVRQVCREQPLPVILVSAHHEDELIQRALHEQVLAYLIKPITRDQLQPAIVLAMRRYREFEALRQQADDLRQALEDRKLIERAKGVLMSRGGLSEPDAFRRLQKLSSDKNQKMVEIARMIVTAEEALAG
ncbi:MAG TPA: response regulator [Planctomycetaceae bacterium]|nr:response regulator [Planctomycetaceae bacterium]